MKKHNKNKRKSYTIIVLLLIICLGIGYAALTTSLKIRSTLSLSPIDFAIHFDNVGNLTNTAVVTLDAQLKENTDKKEIEFVAGLTRLDDYYAFTTDIVNEGSIPGKVVSIELSGLSESQKKLINYDVRYTSTNKKVAIGDYFGPNSTKNITVKVIYELADDVEDTDLPTDIATMDLVFSINFENGSLTEYRARAASSRLMQDVDYMPTSALNFNNPANSNEYQGVYRLDGTENDDFPIYFYRGSNEKINNHVLFGGYCWRILRTTSTGGIKIIYNGTPNEQGQCITLTGNLTNQSLHDYNPSRVYAGSEVQLYLTTWYFEHLIRYQSYLEDTVFCNIYYDTVDDPILTCDSTYQVSMANGNNTYPIGLITTQEAKLCGITNISSTFPWLYTAQNYWTMTGTGGGNAYQSLIQNMMIASTGNVVSYDRSQALGLRPVVSLNSEVVFDTGNGTTTNPYTVSFG